MATLTKLVVVFATLMAMTGKSFFPIVEGLEEWANDLLFRAKKKSNPSSLVATNNTFSWCHGAESTIHEGNVILWFSLPTAMQSKGSLFPSLLPQNDKNLLFAITFLSHYPITHHPHVFISSSQKPRCLLFLYSKIILVFHQDVVAFFYVVDEVVRLETPRGRRECLERH